MKTLINSLTVLLFAVFAFSNAPAAKLDAKVQTVANLKAAFEGETTASAKYAAYAKKAKKEGYSKVALLFEAASKSENVHANNHSAVLEQLGEATPKVKPKFEVKSTKENLQDAVKGEGYEVSTMYPGFIKTSGDGNVTLATISFSYAYKTEQKHLALYKNALDQLNSGKENTLASQYFVCPTCGNTYDAKAPKRCGISMTPSERFLTIK